MLATLSRQSISSPSPRSVISHRRWISATCSGVSGGAVAGSSQCFCHTRSSSGARWSAGRAKNAASISAGVVIAGGSGGAGLAPV